MHTPTPWNVRPDEPYPLKIRDQFDAEICRIGGLSDCPELDEENRNNAALIVRAVNSHAELVATLETAVRWLRRIEQEHPGCLNTDAIGRHLEPTLTKAKA